MKALLVFLATEYTSINKRFTPAKKIRRPPK